jgi:hypothetical protein
MRAPFQLPSRSTSANIRSCPVAPDFTGDAAGGEPSLGDRSGDDFVADGLDVVRDTFEEFRALLGQGGAVGGECGRGRLARRGGVGLVSVLVCGLKLFSGARVEAVDHCTGSADERPGDDHVSAQVRVSDGIAVIVVFLRIGR